MKNYLLLFITFFSIQISFSQNNLWKGYFSYANVKDISRSETAFFAASENAFFSKNLISNEIKTVNTIDGLTSETISAIYYSATDKATLIGYENGLITVVNDVDGKMTKVVDIIKKQLPSGIKKINNFYEYNDIVYVSCDFGIVQFNLKTLLFGDTYFIGSPVSEIAVKKVVVYNGYIYAATTTEGIKKALITNPNLNDASQWSQVFLGNFTNIVAFSNNLFASGTTGQVYKSTDGVIFVPFNSVLSPVAVDLRVSESSLVITTPNTVYVYNSSLALSQQINSSQITKPNVNFTCATIIGTTIYMGTVENGVVTTTTNSIPFEFISPNGPEKNNVFRLKKSSTALWTIYGGYDGNFNPFGDPYRLGRYPISKFTNEQGWSVIPYSKLFGAKSLSSITINPNNENQLFVSSYYSGLLKIENEEPTYLYNETNTSPNGLEKLIDTNPSCYPNCAPDVRINGPVFDKSGNLWMTNNMVNKGLKVLRTNGQWESYDLSKIIIPNAISESYSIPIIDKNGTKWLPANVDGLIVFNEEKNNKAMAIKQGVNGNLPSFETRCVAIDTKNKLWIGCSSGLRVINSVDQFLTETQIQTKPIIINEFLNGENIAQELFYQQFIIDIAVDGGNRKWVSTAEAGVFLISPDGQQTIYHFTKDNSPLPSNTINDIEIDSITGEVFFATNKGLVSFKGTATSANENLGNVYVYPNPVRPEYGGTVKITGLTNKAIVKITDIEGGLVYETTSEGGTIEWDTTAFGKYKVASGVYMVFISAEDGIETKVKKVMIVR